MAIAWIKKLTTKGNGSWRHLPTLYFSKLSPNLTVFKSSITNTNGFRGNLLNLPHVYRSILLYWLRLSHTNDKHTVQNSAQVLWNNNKFMYRGNTLFIQRWINKGITFLCDIMDDNNVISYDKIKHVMGDTGTTRMEYNGVYNAVQRYNGLEQYRDKDYSIYMFNKTLELISNKSIRVYLQMAKYDNTPNKWENTFNNNDNIFNKMWTLACETTKEIKLIVLQWKILHKIYPTNKYLNRIGIEDSSNCQYCETEDTMEHFFYDCPKIKHLWTEVEHDIYLQTNTLKKLTKRDVILGHCDRNHFINFYILIAKQSINVFKKNSDSFLVNIYHKEKNLRGLGHF